MNIVYGIIIAVILTSVYGFKHGNIVSRLMLSPYMVIRDRQWYRIITHGFVHADMPHLLVNMFVLWSFGEYVFRLFEIQAVVIQGMNPTLKFCLLYFGGLIAASSYDLVRYRNNTSFASIGASGAVSAVVFTSIFYEPLGTIRLMAILPLPSILFGILYIGYETYSARHTRDRINHHAHIFGAAYGFLFPMLASGSGEIDTFLRGLGLIS